MLDVHPAQHAAHSWRDFFIHIATIVLGLLIAIGLEQMVERMHHRHELGVIREELRAEIDQNRRVVAEDVQGTSDLQSKLARDMALLLAHRSTNKPLTAKLEFGSAFYPTRDAAWSSAQHSDVLGLMPHAELQHYAYIFGISQAVMMGAGKWNSELAVAKAIASRSPDGQLSPQDTTELITAISNTQGDLAFDAALIGYVQEELKKEQ